MTGPAYTPPALPTAAENGLYRGLLRECAEILRVDLYGCLECDRGQGSTGVDEHGAPCDGCAGRRDLLRRIEAVI